MSCLDVVYIDTYWCYSIMS